MINKPYEALRKNLLVDLHSLKEEFLNMVILKRELYYLVPISLISPSQISSPEKQIASSESSEVVPEKKKREFPASKSKMLSRKKETTVNKAEEGEEGVGAKRDCDLSS